MYSSSRAKESLTHLTDIGVKEHGLVARHSGVRGQRWAAQNGSKRVSPVRKKEPNREGGKLKYGETEDGNMHIISSWSWAVLVTLETPVVCRGVGRSQQQVLHKDRFFGSGNPTWKTKFTVLIDDDTSSSSSSSNLMHFIFKCIARDPIFLREKLQGTTIVVLKEFLDKHTKKRSLIEEVGSFQLRKQSSGKPQGFVDVSIRIFELLDGGIATSLGTY
ncbi:hypothetical protein Scep_017905 [Stephania cephalantha]|uniref:C2 domain-containing protein n=1 Tax=Stephania cephalantha TaxID=152367 RepID=A0AAP0NU25_9MAGN